MRYNLGNEEDLKEARSYLTKLLAQKATIEIKKKTGIRTLNQNNYLHLLLSYCAISIGELLPYFKEVIFKQIINKEIFQTEYTNPKTGEKRVDWRSTADLSTDEMNLAVDRLFLFAAREMGISLPRTSDISRIRQMENHIERNKRLL